MEKNKPFQANFILGAASREQFPKFTLPEIAFIGRSNVGKSSLLNSITLNKNLAKTSSTPGKTRQINFFDVEQKWIMADLPGFGYAAVSKSDRQKFEKLNYEYLDTRENLVLTCILCDARLEPQIIDLGLIEHTELASKNYVVILTKTDKISKKLIEAKKEEFNIITANCIHCVSIIPYSVINNTGRKELISIILKEIKKATH